MRQRLLVLTFSLITSCLCLVVDAQASQIHGIDFNTGTLFTIDTADASTSVIGVGLPLRNGLAFDTDGTLYSNDRDLFGTLDPFTAVPTIINGATGRKLNALSFNADHSQLYGLEFDGAGDGDLLMIDKSDGTAALVGNTGLSFPSSLAINSAGDAFVAEVSVGTLYQLDLTTAGLTAIGNIGEGMTSMGFGSDGVLYGVGLSTDTLYRIDTATGAGTSIGVLPYFDVRGLSSMVIPEPLEVAKTYRHTNTCFERDNDGDGMISEDPMEFGDDGVPLLIDNDDDGLVDEDSSECPDGTNPGDVIDNDGEDIYFVDSVVKKNGKVSSYNPGQLYAVVTVNVLADIEDLHIGEFYTDCTMDPPDLLDLNPKKGGGRAVVVVEHDDGTLEQLFDANTDDPNVEFYSGEDATVVWWMGSFAAGDIYHLYVKFGPGKNSTGDGSCVNNAEAATPLGDELFIAPAEATLVVMPKER